MKNRILFSIFLTVFSFVFTVAAKQEKYNKHTVVKGESINSIAQKYKVTPYDIYKLNPDSQNGIQLDSVLLIPSTTADMVVNSVQNETQNDNPSTHSVKPKETLYSISKQYGVTIEALKAANGDLLNNGLKIGQNIKIPTESTIQKAVISEPIVAIKGIKETPKKVVPKTEPKKEIQPTGTTYHIIEPKETKYGISKKYGMTISELERLNPQIASDFPIGYKLVVSGNTINQSVLETSKPVVETTKPVVEKVTAPTSSTKKYLEEYVVRPMKVLSPVYW